MKNIVIAVIFAAAPAAAQTTVRVPISGVNAIPGLGASFDVSRLGAAPMLMPVLSPGAQMPALSASALIPTPIPALVQPAPATGILAAAAKPVEGSPLGVLRDDSADEAQKTAALDRLFENSAPSSPEALEVSAQSAAATGDQDPTQSSAPSVDQNPVKEIVLKGDGIMGPNVPEQSRAMIEILKSAGQDILGVKILTQNGYGKPLSMAVSYRGSLPINARVQEAAKAAPIRVDGIWGDAMRGVRQMIDILKSAEQIILGIEVTSRNGYGKILGANIVHLSRFEYDRIIKQAK